MVKNILFVCGSLNQTTMMHQIATELSEYKCYFTPFYTHGILKLLSQQGLLDFTILGGRHRQMTEAYLNENYLPIDDRGDQRNYDLVVTCTDLIVQKNLLGKRMILVQEGMMETEGLLYNIVRTLKLPRYLANTAMTGLSNAYDIFCVASEGYRELFIRKGVRPEKIAVTGIPNFDNAKKYLQNDFPYRHFVLVATSPARETFKWDNRAAFLRRVQHLADGRQIIIKLHPSENLPRARREIKRYLPEALVYENGNLHEMIANCDILITQYTSATFTGLALGKVVYSYLDINNLSRLLPIQNGGVSAWRIAQIGQRLITLPESGTIQTGDLHGILAN